MTRGAGARARARARRGEFPERGGAGLRVVFLLGIKITLAVPRRSFPTRPCSSNRAGHGHSGTQVANGTHPEGGKMLRCPRLGG